MADEGSVIEIALDDPGFYLGDVEAAYSWLRREAPVYRYEPADCWALSKYQDISYVGRTPELFSSMQGITIGAQGQTGAVDGATPMLIFMDPPAHNQYRQLVSKGFTPRIVKELEGRIRQITAESLDAVPPGEVVDFVEMVALPLPMLVIAELLGVPFSDRADFRRWSDAVIAGDDSGMVAMGELFGYFAEKLDEREKNPADDLMGRLLVAEVDGERLTKQDMLNFCVTLLIAGNETTRNLISGGALALMEHPDQKAALVADPGLLPNAVEEMLRWVTPVKTFARTVVRDTEIRGQDLAAGDYVVLLYAAANRDEDIWGATAPIFDVARPLDPQHLAFGWGEHACMGANLARLEVRVMFEQLLARMPGFALAGEPVRLSSTLINGIVELPVTFAP